MKKKWISVDEERRIDMKKTIVVLCLVMSMILIGCDSEPMEWDHRSEGWELWASGVVDRAVIEINGSMRTFIIEFEGELKVEETLFHNFNDVEEKTYGSVYRYYGGIHHYYMWVPSVKILPIIVKENIESEVISEISPVVKNVIVDYKKIVDIEPNKQSYGWQSLLTPPTSYQTVLVKFKDGIVTTAYLTPTGKWKSEINRNKLSGGIALKNISQWKLINLE